jgi:hypothetical protein
LLWDRNTKNVSLSLEILQGDLFTILIEQGESGSNFTNLGQRHIQTLPVSKGA